MIKKPRESGAFFHMYNKQLNVIILWHPIITMMRFSKKRESLKIQLNSKSLNEEQKEAKAKILENTVTLLAGSAGSGKTLLACQIALEKLFTKEMR
jgi:phosphate starvation-inducible protein PhoH